MNQILESKPENKVSASLCSKIKNRHISKLSDDKLLYCEAFGSYTWIYLVNGNKIKVSCRLNIVEEKLNSSTFIRCHKSFIINIKYIEDFSEKKPYTLKLVNSTILPISGCRRSALLEQILQLV